MVAPKKHNANFRETFPFFVKVHCLVQKIRFGRDTSDNLTEQFATSCFVFNSLLLKASCEVTNFIIILLL